LHFSPRTDYQWNCTTPRSLIGMLVHKSGSKNLILRFFIQIVIVIYKIIYLTLQSIKNLTYRNASGTIHRGIIYGFCFFLNLPKFIGWRYCMCKCPPLLRAELPNSPYSR